MSAKSIIKSVASSSLFSNGLKIIEKHEFSSKNLLRILVYHRIDIAGDTPQLNPDIVSCSPDEFNRQMEYISNNYHPISVYDVIEHLEAGQPLPPKSVLVTFDDAYVDFGKYALEILQNHKVPALLFVPTAYPDNPGNIFWWDKLYNAVFNTRDSHIELFDTTISLDTPASRLALVDRLTGYVKSRAHNDAMQFIEELCNRLDSPDITDNYVMGWDQLVSLHNEGVVLAAHTRNHPLVTRISVEEAKDEAVASRNDLRAKIGTSPSVFAYPSGAVTPEVASHLADAGFKLAFTTTRGINDLQSSNKMLLRRINVSPGIPLPVLRPQLVSMAYYLNRFFD